MEEGFKDAQTAGWEFFNTFKDEEFWYSFLEQAVQTYSRLVDAEEITDAPQTVIDALVRINDMQENFNYAYDEELKAARDTDEAQDWPFDTLASFRTEKNYEAIQQTEEDAKLVLKEIVMTELNTMGKKFIDNLRAVGFNPMYKDMDYYFMQYFCRGAGSEGGSIELQGDFIEKAEALPKVPYEQNEDADGPYYTDGGELSTQPDGDDYVGYYHVTKDEMGNIIYMEGEQHTDAPHGELTAYAHQIVVKVDTVTAAGDRTEKDLGDIADYDTVTVAPDSEKPFIIEKYISINGTRYDTEYAYDKIVANDPEANLHDIYPGTLETVKTVVIDEHTGEEKERVVGITGEMGVRYGLEFSVVMGAKKLLLTSIELDALDLPVKAFKKLAPNTKILLCLIKLLKKDNTFRLLSRYIFSTTKMTAILAMYNDVGFMPSIGEKTTPRPGWGLTGDGTAQNSQTPAHKPGMRITVNPDDKSLSYGSTDGWQYGGSAPRRNDSWGIREWDNWDQILLRNSKARIKRLFKAYYNTREFNPTGDGDFKPSQILINNLKSSMYPPVGMNLFGWFTPFRTNPFNSDGQLCKK